MFIQAVENIETVENDSQAPLDDHETGFMVLSEDAVGAPTLCNAVRDYSK